MPLRKSVCARRGPRQGAPRKLAHKPYLTTSDKVPTRLQVRQQSHYCHVRRAQLENEIYQISYISIYGETIRREMQEKTLIVTFVTTDVQLADPLTKPTTTKINDNILPLLGLVARNQAIAVLNSEDLREEKTMITMHSASARLRAQRATINARNPSDPNNNTH